ncbi:protein STRICTOSIDINE SYNTHASE-LIKE 10-like [Andrographis paniculata]|uniref:protein STRICTOSIDINE SYNTHASE-LIKE 10-like n=1 Tax=Andrographis paniculata TaxID=175694 RepID=UPI0021E709BD|nr:protein STRICTOSIDINE SYNTHASE-LIKE 10-like [Andrographis paniculata]
MKSAFPFPLSAIISGHLLRGAAATPLISAACGVVFLAVAAFTAPDDRRPPVSNRNDTLIEFHRPELIPLPGGAVGPESFAFDAAGGGPYTGVSDGRILRWLSNESRWSDFAVTSPHREGCVGPYDHSRWEHKCGRPLGLKFDPNTGNMYIADAYMGLLVVGPNGGQAQKVAHEEGGVPFGLTNSLDIDHDNGVVYFTDSSSRFPRRNFVSVIISGDNSGRLMKFDIRTKKTTLLLDNLKFPNGISLSKNRDFLLFVETTTCKLYKLWLKSHKKGNVELMSEFHGFPDNIKRNENGEFWVGINSRRGVFLKWFISNTWIGNTLVRTFPVDVTKVHSYLAYFISAGGMGFKLDKDGNIVKVLDSSTGKRWKFVSEVDEQHGNLWVGSVVRHFLVKDKIST